MTINRWISIILLILSISIETYGQIDKTDSTFLNIVIKRSGNTEIYYLEKSVGWERLKENLTKRKFVGYSKGKTKCILKLTRNEQAELLKQIEYYTNYKWDDNLFYRSVKIQNDSMWIFLQNENRKRIKKLNNAILSKDTSTQIKMGYAYSWVNGFSKPIYIRNNKICLFYHFAMCGNQCGRDELCFYKKENDFWVRWIVVRQGDF